MERRRRWPVANAGLMRYAGPMTTQAKPPAPAAELEIELCPHCAKPLPICICAEIAPIANRVAVLVLQHPAEEQDRTLGSARVATRKLANSVFRIGLSWPSLSKALGQPAEPSEWAVLHLGSTKLAELPENREVVVFDKKGVLQPEQDRALAGIKGVVIFDGTWAQAKTLWWRNAWVLKMRRLVLAPEKRRRRRPVARTAARACRRSRPPVSRSPRSSASRRSNANCATRLR